MLDQVKKMMSLRKKAKEIQQKLSGIHIEADEGEVTVTVNGKQELISCSIKSEDFSNKTRIEHDIVKAANKAMKKSQEIAAKEMKEVMGDLGLSGMTGAGN